MAEASFTSMPPDMKKDLNLLLLGLSGTGKSSTLKSIVMKGDIDIQGGWKSITDSCHEEEVKVEGRVIKVVDTPGLFSTNTNGKSTKARVEQLRKSINETFQRFPTGFHAYVLVLSYGRRFGQEDAKTIKILKETLGSSWLKTHGVALVTFGDNFVFDVEGTNETFSDWCRNQRGPMGELFKECNFRCVLFDNVTLITDALVEQRAKLFSIVDELQIKHSFARQIVKRSNSEPVPTENPEGIQDSANTFCRVKSLEIGFDTGLNSDQPSADEKTEGVQVQDSAKTRRVKSLDVADICLPQILEPSDGVEIS